MKLYLSPGACSMAIHVLLEELGQPFEIAVVSVQRGETGHPSFLARNPKGRVPVLELEDGTIITELIAIVAYLHLRFPAQKLVPLEPVTAARVWEWLSWLGSEVHSRSFGAIWRPERFTQDQQARASVKHAGRISVVEQFAMIEAKLDHESGGWAVGTGPTCVDPLLLVYYQWGRWIQLDMRTRYPAWTSHTERMLRRPAVRRVLEREGLDEDLLETVP